MRLRIAILSLSLVAALGARTRAQQPDQRRAGLVVVHGDGSVASVCVAFSEESISGAELLRRSGLGVTLDPYGGLGYGVCAIGGEGCPAGQDCFCQCRATPCAYWVYSHRRPDGSWAISGAGASSWQVHDGDVDGWVWGDGSTAPPGVAFEQVCPSGAAPPVSPTTVSEPPPPTITSAPLPSPTVAPSPFPSPPINSTPLPSPVLPTAMPQPTDQPTNPPIHPLTFSPTATPAPFAPSVTEGSEAEGSALSETQEPTAQATDQERGNSLLGYGVFGVVVLGLVGWLMLAAVRRRHA
jgi:hypothetical protein